MNEWNDDCLERETSGASSSSERAVEIISIQFMPFDINNGFLFGQIQKYRVWLWARLSWEIPWDNFVKC